MKALKDGWWVLTTLCVFVLPPIQSLLILEVMKLAEFTFSNVYHAWDLVAPKLTPLIGESKVLTKSDAELYNFQDNKPAFYYESQESQVMSRLKEMQRKILEIEERLKNAEINLLRHMNKIPKQIMREMKVNQVMDIIKTVEARYETFMSYMSIGTKEINDGKPGLDRKTIISFADYIVSQKPESPMHILDKLHGLLVPHQDSDRLLGTPGFFETFRDYINSDDLSCEVNQSPQQMMFNLYTTFQLTQLKAYTMIHFSWMLLRIYDQGNFEVENGLLKQTYWQRMSQQANALQNVVKDCKSELWACDSISHREEETYTKITRFLQGYIVNEVDLNSDGTCRENCAFYTYAKQQGCFKNQFCSRQRTCRGNIVGCSFVDSDMLICQAPHFTERRYDWIRYENGRTLGQGRSCDRGVEAVDSWWRYLFWHCSYCFCYCDDPKDSQSDRYFSLRPVTAETDKNKVVTGLKFVKNNQIIHIQIQQGELLPHGEINETTIEWLPVDNFEVTDNDVAAGKDYHLLTWEHRSFDLDDLVVNSGQVMTGIKIKLLGSHMNIEIQGAEFNYTTGKLSHGGTKTQWYSNDNTDVAYSKPRTEHNLQKADVPDRSFGLNKPDSKPDTYIRFSPSDPDFDAAQSTVPYIDIQAVSPKPASALVGAGIFHKGREYSGGYLAPKVFTFNQGDHLQQMFPDLNETEF